MSTNANRIAEIRKALGLGEYEGRRDVGDRREAYIIAFLLEEIDRLQAELNHSELMRNAHRDGMAAFVRSLRNKHA